MKSSTMELQMLIFKLQLKIELNKFKIVVKVQLKLLTRKSI